MRIVLLVLALTWTLPASSWTVLRKRPRCTRRIARLADAAARRAGLPPRVVGAIIVVESGCDADAVSTDGAVGLMQVRPRLHGYTRAELLQPGENIRAGVSVLRTLVDRYGLWGGVRHYNGSGAHARWYVRRIFRVAYPVR